MFRPLVVLLIGMLFFPAMAGAQQSKINDLERKIRELERQRDEAKRDKVRIQQELESKLRTATSLADGLKREIAKLKSDLDAERENAKREKTRADNLQKELEDLRKTAHLGKNSIEVHTRVHRVLIVARAGNAMKAIKEADQLAQGKDLDPLVYIELARVYGLAITQGAGGADNVDAHAGKAIALLRTAKDRRYLITPEDVEQFSRDADFKALSSRPSFRELMKEWAASK